MAKKCYKESEIRQRVFDRSKNANTVTLPDAQNDAFGRLRASLPETMFDSLQIVDKQEDFWDEQVTGGATSVHSTDRASTIMTVGTASGDKVIRQTKEFFRYNSGKSQMYFMTGYLGVQKTGVRQRIGAFYEDNGIFFEQDENNLKVVIRSHTSGSPVDIAVNQSDWNLDKLDGTGDSEIILDTSLAQIFVIDFQWLGVGKVRFGFGIGGKVVYCHEVQNANMRANPYTSTGNLPVRYEIENIAASANSTEMLHTCVSIISEGGQARGSRRCIDSSIPGITIGGAAGGSAPILSLRLKDAYIRSRIIVDTITALSTDKQDFAFWLVINGQLTGAVWTDVDTTSIAQYDESATAVTGGIRLECGLVGGNLSVARVGEAETISDLKLVSDIAGVSDTVTLVAKKLSAPNITIFGSLGWKEVI